MEDGKCDVGDRAKSIRRNVEDVARGLIAMFRANAIPRLCGATDSREGDKSTQYVVAIYSSQPSTGPAKSRLAVEVERWEPIPPLGLSAQEAGRRDVLKVARMAKVMRIPQDIAPAVGSIGEQEQPDMVAVWATRGELAKSSQPSARRAAR